jgi:hypothetical protein
MCLHILQVFQRYVARVCSKCIICLRRMLKMFYLYDAYVTKVMLQVYVLNVLSVSVVCCNCFYLSVAEVDLDVGWSRVEERASAGAMATSVVSWWHRSTRGRASVRTSVCGPRVGPGAGRPGAKLTKKKW